MAPRLDPKLADRLPVRVLLCDDNLVNQKVASRILQQMGYKAAFAANGEECLRHLDAHGCDLIFMDVQMPVMDGLEATRIIRQREAEKASADEQAKPITVIAMTASAMTGDRERCMESGMDDYLSKPVRPDDVRRMLEKWAPVVNAPAASNNNGAIPPAGTPPMTDVQQAAPPTEPVVDMTRLMDLASNSEEALAELMELYFSQTSRQLEQLKEAIKTSNAPEVRRIAHSCAGASATCGMLLISPVLRELEHQAHEGKLDNAPGLCQKAELEFDRIKLFFQERSSKQQIAEPIH